MYLKTFNFEVSVKIQYKNESFIKISILLFYNTNILLEKKENLVFLVISLFLLNHQNASSRFLFREN